MGEVLAVCRVHELHADAGTVGVTAIDKRPVDGRVKVGPLGLYADVQADRAHHGGNDQAVYVYAQEDADFWAGELGREIPPGQFGENLRTSGVDVDGAVIGERWSVGTAVLEVTQPRVPCQTFARRLGEKQWVRRFTRGNRTGAYLRVVRNGEIGAGDAVEVLVRPEHGVTVRDWFAARFGLARGSADLGPDDRGLADADALEVMAKRLLSAHATGDITLSSDMLRRAEQAAGRSVVD